MSNKCGAKTRAGGRCRKGPMPNGRCKYHGGMSTGPKVPNSRLNAFKHGIYTKHLLPDEIAISQTIVLGTVDDEIRLTRMRLRRALAAEAASHGEPELDSIVERQLIGDEGSREDRTSKVRDYVGIIDRLTVRIESLERTRRELMKSAQDDPDEDDKRPIGRIVVEVVHAKPSHDHDRAAG